MSSELRNKLLNTEAAPPPQVWSNIAAQLDDCGFEFQFPSVLKNAEAAPPANTFQNIITALNNEILAPRNAAALYQMEVAPPAAAWAAIKKNLDITAEAAIPEHRRFVPFIKYAAAAAVAGLMFWGGLQLFNNKKGDKGLAVNPVNTSVNTADTPQKNTTATLPDDVNVTDDVTSAIDEARNDAALEESKQVYAKVDVPALKRRISKTFDATALLPDPAVTVGERGFDISETYATADDQLATTDKYIVLMTPEGNIIRMSKKMCNLVCCVSGEEQDNECVDQMSKWRKQMADHPKALSPGNFIDIVSLINSLQDN
jgi:hypothetical protein